MHINISAEKNRESLCSDQDIRNSIPEGAIIENVRLVKFKENTEYERLCLLIDFKYDFEQSVSPERTLLLVLKYNEGFKGNLIEHSARFKEYPTLTNPMVEYDIPANSKVNLCWFEREDFIDNFNPSGNLQCFVMAYHHNKTEHRLVVVLKSPDDYHGQLCKSYPV